jgi:hypothetical protein
VALRSNRKKRRFDLWRPKVRLLENSALKGVSRMQRLLIAASLLCAVALLALPSSAAGGHRIFAMTSENGSGENGAVILTPLGDTTRVQIAVANAAEAAIQPAHVHAGACFEVGKVVYPLKDVVEGSSVTVLKVPIATLLAGGLAINVHIAGVVKGDPRATDVKYYTSCANLK